MYVTLDQKRLREFGVSYIRQQARLKSLVPHRMTE